MENPTQNGLFHTGNLLADITEKIRVGIVASGEIRSTFLIVLSRKTCLLLPSHPPSPSTLGSPLLIIVKTSDCHSVRQGKREKVSSDILFEEKRGFLCLKLQLQVAVSCFTGSNWVSCSHQTSWVESGVC